MKAKKLKNSHSKAAYLFLSPWLIGFLLFTAFPFFYTLYLSFSNVSLNVNGWGVQYTGLSNYVTAFAKSSQFDGYLVQFLTIEVIYVPTIVVLSIILSMLLNQKIQFRAGFRTIFFFPVIVLSGSVLKQISDTNIMTISGLKNIFIYKIIDSYSPFFAKILTDLFNQFSIVLWFTGIPIILFINGLQKISRQMYEAAEIDGANGWQIFWKITMPQIKSTALIATIFVIVQLGVYQINPLYEFINNIISNQQSMSMGYASAIAWIYTVCILAFVGITMLLLRDRYKVSMKEDLQARQIKKIRRIQKYNNRKEIGIKDVIEFTKKQFAKYKRGK